MGRRDKGSGSVSHRGKDVYRLRVYMGRDPVTHLPRYASKTIRAKNITGARSELATFITEQQGQAVGTNATVRTLMAEWLAQITSDGKAPRTIAEAKRTTDQLINPTLGDVQLSELTGRHIDEMNRKTAGLKPSTRRRYHAVLAAALNQAVKWGWIDVSPAIRANAPKVGESSLVFPTEDEVLALIDAMPTEVWKMALRLALVTGARRGELCGLRWTDITPDWLLIRRSVYRHDGETTEKVTKSGRERRIPMEPSVAALFTAWHAWCDQRAASVEVAVAPDAYVLSTWPDSSRPLNPDTLSAHVRRATRDLGIDHVHFHSLRHLAATNMLARGVPVRDVAEALGHSDGGRLVLRVYGHPTSDQQRAAAAAMASAMVLPALPSPTEEAS